MPGCRFRMDGLGSVSAISVAALVGTIAHCAESYSGRFAGPNAGVEPISTIPLCWGEIPDSAADSASARWRAASSSAWFVGAPATAVKCLALELIGRRRVPAASCAVQSSLSTYPAEIGYLFSKAVGSGRCCHGNS